MMYLIKEISKLRESVRNSNFGISIYICSCVFLTNIIYVHYVWAHILNVKVYISRYKWFMYEVHLTIDKDILTWLYIPIVFKVWIKSSKM